MFDGTRLRDLMNARGISQSALARQVGVSQTTVAKLVLSKGYGSKHLHRIARELGTTPAYLAGETDDPDLNAPPPPPPTPPRILLEVTLPPERALARMFQALLAGIDPKASRDEQALLLAKRLPIGLSQLRDLLPESAMPSRPEREDADEAHAMPHPEPTR